MRFFVLLLAFLACTDAYSQYQYGYSTPFFFGRVPNARAEAMGKAYTSINSGLNAIYYNPAGLSGLSGYEINASFAAPYYYLEEGNFLTVGGAAKFNKYLKVGVTYFKYGYTYPDFTESTSTTTLSVASEPLNGLHIGLSGDYYRRNLSTLIGPHEKQAYMLNFGVNKEFRLFGKSSSLHKATIGSSVKNFTFASARYDTSTVETTMDELPGILRIGVNYQYAPPITVFTDSIHLLHFMLQGEYQVLLNADFHEAFRVGGEVLIAEILALRAGYYVESQFNFGYEENYEVIKDLTFGVGLKLPLRKISDVPLDIALDFTSLPQTPYSELFDEDELGSFNSISMKVVWVPKGEDCMSCTDW